MLSSTSKPQLKCPTYLVVGGLTVISVTAAAMFALHTGHQPVKYDARSFLDSHGSRRRLTVNAQLPPTGDATKQPSGEEGEKGNEYLRTAFQVPGWFTWVLRGVGVVGLAGVFFAAISLSHFDADVAVIAATWLGFVLTFVLWIMCADDEFKKRFGVEAAGTGVLTVGFAFAGTANWGDIGMHSTYSSPADLTAQFDSIAIGFGAAFLVFFLFVYSTQGMAKGKQLMLGLLSALTVGSLTATLSALVINPDVGDVSTNAPSDAEIVGASCGLFVSLAFLVLFIFWWNKWCFKLDAAAEI